MLTNKNIRNISIIAHVDHGKSTLADRLIETSGLINPGDHVDQFAHSYAAIEAGLDIIPVINKVDSIDVDIENVSKQIFNLIGAREDEIFKISAKSGLGVDSLINQIPDLISSPVTKADNTNALIFDSYFDPYRGVIASVRVFGGEIKTNSKLKLINSKFDFDASEDI